MWNKDIERKSMKGQHREHCKGRTSGSGPLGGSTGRVRGMGDAGQIYHDPWPLVLQLCLGT